MMPAERRGAGPEDDSVAYDELIGDFLDAYSCKSDTGGYAAFYGDLIDEADDLVRVEGRLTLFVSPVRLIRPERPPEAEGLPALWFVTSESGPLSSFVVETGMLLDELPHLNLPGSPLPAYEARDPENGTVRAGDLFHMQVRRVRIAAAPGLEDFAELPLGGAILFELGVGVDGDAKAVRSLTMAGITPFLALSAAAEAADAATFAAQLEVLEGKSNSGTAPRVLGGP